MISLKLLNWTPKKIIKYVMFFLFLSISFFATHTYNSLALLTDLLFLIKDLILNIKQVN